MCQGAPYRSLQALGDRGAVLYALHASRGPSLIYNGLEDNVVNIPNHGRPFFQDLRERTIELMGGEANVFDVGFLNWSDQDIREMPETRIGSWAEK